MSRRRVSWALVLLSAVAFGLRVQGLAFQSLWRDEVDSLRFAVQPVARLAQGFVIPGHNGPLYYLLLRPWVEACGQSEFSLRFFSVAMGVLAVPLFYRVGLQFVARRPAVSLVAALLAATSPYLVWYSQEARMYAAVVCITLASMYCFPVALEKGGWQRWLGYVLLTGTAFYMHLLAALIVPAQAGIFAVLRSRRSPEAPKWFLGSVAALVIPYLPLLAWQLPLLLGSVPSSYPSVSLPQMLASLIVCYGGGVVGGSSVWTLAPLLVLVGAAAILARPDCQLGTVVGAAIWLLMPILELFLVTLRYPVFTARYLVFVLPALLLLAAMGVQAVGQRSRWLAALLLAAVLASNLNGLWRQARTPLKADFRSATQYLVSEVAPGDRIVFQIPYGRYSFEYYLEHSRPARSPMAIGGNRQVFLPMIRGARPSSDWIDGLYTNGGMSPDEVDGQMAWLVGNSHIVWFVASEAAMWDERGLVQSWLDSHATLTGRAEFVRVSVHRYTLR